MSLSDDLTTPFAAEYADSMLDDLHASAREALELSWLDVERISEAMANQMAEHARRIVARPAALEAMD